MSANNEALLDSIAGNGRSVVLNSGTHPEPVYWASAIQRLRGRCDYLTSTTWHSDALIMRAAKAAGSLHRSTSETLLRRQLPTDIARFRVIGKARVQALREHLPLGAQGATEDQIEMRMQRFRSASEKWVTRHRPDVVVGQYTSALGAFRAAHDSYRVLLYPIAHHDWMKNFLSEEALLNPEWARFLQGHDLTAQRRDVLEEEISLADKIIVPSSFAKRTFIESGVSAARVEVMSLGADPGLLDEAEMRDSFSKKNNRSGPIRVIFAGQVNQRKGIFYLLDAIRELGPKVAGLTIAGPISSETRTFIEKKYSNTEFFGPMPRHKLARLMASADVLALPSLAEGFGLVAIEAMQSGTPVILSDRTFGSDIVAHDRDGWIVQAGSSVEIAQVISRIYDDRSIALRVGHHATRTASKYTWQSYEVRVSSFIDDLARDSAA
ncbi:glycosyltransferase involved in cell wall biosynthesis [Microbacterium trichothecenolyticum]|uniref:Glycosyltransferase involved in cell wall biosynthesis n=2 Tax=Microbacterium trichothecenolyticum TaxID=69370 RepID=A0ABU0TXT6_MICTR|nr:glycosyltransferase involved in cell wall biosynthesis [Microbacterium trichothecenolyticum]